MLTGICAEWYTGHPGCLAASDGRMNGGINLRVPLVYVIFKLSHCFGVKPFGERLGVGSPKSTLYFGLENCIVPKTNKNHEVGEKKNWNMWWTRHIYFFFLPLPRSLFTSLPTMPMAHDLYPVLWKIVIRNKKFLWSANFTDYWPVTLYFFNDSRKRDNAQYILMNYAHPFGSHSYLVRVRECKDISGDLLKYAASVQTGTSVNLSITRLPQEYSERGSSLQILRLTT